MGVRSMWNRGWMVVGVALAAITLGGCAGGDKARQTLEGEFAGPPIALDSSGSTHQLVVQAPTPGWFVRLDSTEQTAEATQAYVSLVEPNPRMVYTQQVVEQRLGLTVDIGEDVELFARIVPFEKKDNSTEPYTRVGLVPAS